MSKKNPKFDMDFLLQWILANAVGWAVTAGVVVLVPLGLDLLPNHLFEDLSCGMLNKVLNLGIVVAGFVFGALVGVSVGIMQGLVLRRRVLMSGRWVLACAVGWGFAFVITAFALFMDREASQSSVLDRFGGIVVWPLMGALGGSYSGIMQSFVLKTQVPRSGWWVVVSTLGWAMALSVGGYCIYVIDWVFMMDVGRLPVGAGIVAGIIGGGITGIPLTLLLRSHSLGLNKRYDSVPHVGCVLVIVLFSILTGGTFYIRFIGPPIIWDTDPENPVLILSDSGYPYTHIYAQIWGDGRITWRNGNGYLTRAQMKALFKRVLDEGVSCMDVFASSMCGSDACMTIKLLTVERTTCVNSCAGEYLDYPFYDEFNSLYRHIIVDGAGARSSP